MKEKTVSLSTCEMSKEKVHFLPLVILIQWTG